MKKILIIMGGYFPGVNYGGPPVSIDNFCSLLKDDILTYILTSNHDLGFKEIYNIGDEWIDRGNCKVRYISNSEWRLSFFSKVFEAISPDMIYLQSIFRLFTPMCLYLAKKKDIPVLLAPRGELCEGAISIKKIKKIPYLLLLRILGLYSNSFFQSTSQDEYEGIIKYLNIDSSHVLALRNIPSIPSVDKQWPRKESGKARFVFVSRIVRKKNLLKAIEYLSDIQGTVSFDIYGSIEDKVYWNECLKAISLTPLNVHIEYKGVVSHDQIHEIIRQYDGMIFPTFSENYGHVIAEALGVGCPVIISDQTPWNDVNQYQSGFAIPLRENDEFGKAVQSIVDMDEPNMLLYRENAITLFYDKFCIDELKDDYLAAIYYVTQSKG